MGWFIRHPLIFVSIVIGMLAVCVAIFFWRCSEDCQRRGGIPAIGIDCIEVKR
jgi:hypothetical protein